MQCASVLYKVNLEEKWTNASSLGGRDLGEGPAVPPAPPAVPTAPPPATLALPSEPVECSHGTMRCRNQVQCVRYHYVCDGHSDCRDGSDEDECLTSCDPGDLWLVVGHYRVGTSPRLTQPVLHRPVPVRPRQEVHPPDGGV